MAPLKNPLFSLTASGRLTRAFTLARRLTGPGWLLRGRPADPKTEPQLSWRTMWQLAARLWHDLSAAEQAAWESAGTARGMTGFAWYMSQALRPNPGIYLPLAGGTMTGDIDTDGNKVTGLTDPTLVHHAARKGYVDSQAGEHSLPHWRRLSRYHFSSLERHPGSTIPADDYIYAVPFYSPDAYTITKIGIRIVNGVAGSARLGIYQDDGSVYPGALLSDCGTVDVTAGGNKEIAALSIDISPNSLYWLAYLSDVMPNVAIIHPYGAWQPIGSSTPFCDDLHGCYYVATAYGALPTPYPAGATSFGDARPAIGVYLT